MVGKKAAHARVSISTDATTRHKRRRLWLLLERFVVELSSAAYE